MFLPNPTVSKTLGIVPAVNMKEYCERGFQNSYDDDNFFLAHIVEFLIYENIFWQVLVSNHWYCWTIFEDGLDSLRNVKGTKIKKCLSNIAQIEGSLFPTLLDEGCNDCTVVSKVFLVVMLNCDWHPVLP